MRSIRRLGFLLLVLFLGIVVGNFGLRLAFVVFVPLFSIWFFLWDEKKYRQMIRTRRVDEQYYQDTIYKYHQ